MPHRSMSRLSLLAILVLALGFVPAAEPARADEPTPPAIASFSPPSGGVGDRVTIAGAGFTGAFAVIFGSRTTTFTVDSDAQISATVPEDAGTGPIRVQAPGGEVSSAQPFVVVPSVRTFSPSGGPPGTLVVIQGANFAGATRVTFGGVAATSFRTLDRRGRLIQARVPTGARSGPIGVTTPVGTGASRGDFIVEEVPLPTFRGFAPGRGGPGARVQIFGTNFAAPDDRRVITLEAAADVAPRAEGDLVTAVEFRRADGRQVRARFLVDSATQITAFVPRGAVTGPITLIGRAGSATSRAQFRVLGTPPPCPAAGSVAAADESCLRPFVTIESAANVKEGAVGNRTVAEFPVKLSSRSSERVTVDYERLNVTAKHGEDYELAKGTLTFEPGETEKRIRVTIYGDNKIEQDEPFLVEISNASPNAILYGTKALGTCFILNDDGPIVSIADSEVTETDFRPTEMTFRLTLSRASAEPFTVKFATADGTAKTQEDYLGEHGTVTFAPGETDKTIDVTVLGELLIEQDETILVNLSSQVGGVIGDGEATGTIRNNDEEGRVVRPLSGSR